MARDQLIAFRPRLTRAEAIRAARAVTVRAHRRGREERRVVPGPPLGGRQFGLQMPILLQPLDGGGHEPIAGHGSVQNLPLAGNV